MRSYLEEHFPHLIPGLVENWGKVEAFKAFVSSLIFDTRSGRRGWPNEAWDEISFLDALHHLAYPTEHPDTEEVLLDDTIKWVSCPPVAIGCR